MDVSFHPCPPGSGLTLEEDGSHGSSVHVKQREASA